MMEENPPTPGSRFGIISIILMFIPILSILAMDAIVYPLTGKLPNSIERTLIGLLAVLPPLAGFIFALVGLAKKEHRKWLHIIGLLFNLLQTLYFGFLVSFAG